MSGNAGSSNDAAGARGGLGRVGAAVGEPLNAEQIIAALGLETLEDLCYAFTSSQEAQEQEDLLQLRGLHMHWTRTRSCPSSLAGAKRVLMAARAQQEPPAKRLKLPEPRGSQAQNFAFDSDRRAKAAKRVWDVASRWLPAHKQEPIMDKCMSYEAHTIDGHIRAWIRWDRWAGSRRINALAPRATDVHNFLKTAAQSARPTLWGHLTWLVKELSAPLPLSAEMRPRHSLAATKAPQQAAVPTPEFLKAFLETGHNNQADQKSNTWMIAAGAHLMRLGIIRWRHIQRSSLLELNTYTLVGCCYRSKTKQAGRRAAFIWACPRYDELGQDFGGRIWKNWRHQSDAANTPLTCALPIGGKPMSMHSFHEGMRAASKELTDEAAEISSYSWRRFAATLADVRNVDHAARLKLGGWREQLSTNGPTQNGLGKNNNMPYHYAADKQASEKIEKLAQLLTLAECWPTLSSWAQLRGAISKKIEEEASRKATSMAADDVVEQEVPKAWKPEDFKKDIRLKLSFVEKYRNNAQKKKEQDKKPKMIADKHSAIGWMASRSVKAKLHLEGQPDKPICGTTFSRQEYRSGKDIVLHMRTTNHTSVCDKCFNKAAKEVQTRICEAIKIHGIIE